MKPHHAIPAHSPPPRRLRGISLLELLVVLVVVLAISAVAMRTMAPAFASRKLREGARMVNVFINAARNRAIQTNRPTGVWIDRIDGLPEAAAALAYAQVAEPYSGDFSDSSLVGVVFPESPDWRSPQNTQYYVNIVYPATPRGANMDFWYTPDPKVQNLIRPGDFLKVNYQNFTYTLDTTLNTRFARSLPYPMWVVGIGADASNITNANNGAFRNSRRGDGGWDIDWFMGVPGVRWPLVTPGSTMPGSGLCAGLPYQILRRPSRQSAGSIQLPDEVVIDLNYSGDPSFPYHPRRVPGMTGSPPNAYGVPGSTGVIAPPETPDDTTPVIIMFNPSGAVEQIYCRRWNTTTLIWEWGPNRLASQQYLLIGKREKVPCKLDLTIEAQAQNNYTDPECLWVTIIPSSGLVATTPSVPVVGATLPSSSVPSARGWATQIQVQGGH